MDDGIDLTKDDASGGLQSLEQQLVDVDEELQEVEEALQALGIRQLQLQQQKEDLQRRITADKRAPKADWTNAAFEWDAELKAGLQAVFGLHTFRPLQREVMNATLRCRDVLLLLPSGGGKSLCYQLPALISGGITLVVSPLLSLITDQVMGLSGRVQAYALTSLTSKEEAATVMAALTAAAATTAGMATGHTTTTGTSNSHALLLYVTPEKIVASKRLMAKLEKVYQAGRLSRIAVDEAHCCSTWGNDFRPDYKKLGVLKQQFPDTPIIALTATATLQVCHGIKSILQISGGEQFTASINRPNLCYEVMRKPTGADAAAADDIRNWIVGNYPDGESGIVYCLTRKDCELLARQLQMGGITAAHYHADMEPEARAASHSTWSSGKVQVMVATIAFGMGINKPNVRWVLHACLSKSLENYYQESGRAGRDGQPARCVLRYRLPDVLRQASVVCMDPNWQRHLLAMTRYAAAADGCRRAVLTAHFGEAPSPCNNMCDLCKAAAANTNAAESSNDSMHQQQDLTAAALSVVAALKARRSEKRATLNQLLDDLQKGSRKSNNSKDGGDNCSREELEWAIEQMLLHGLLSIEFGFTAYTTNSYLVTTAAGDALCNAKGNQRFTATRPSWLAKQQAIGTAKSRVAAEDKLQLDQSSEQLQLQQQQQQQPKRANKKRDRDTLEIALVHPYETSSDSDDFAAGPA